MWQNPKCAHNHLGLWLVEPVWMQQALMAIRAGNWPLRNQAEFDASELYRIEQDGIAVIGLSGPITKGISKYGGTSSVLARRAIRAALKDKQVKAILLSIDSPGGTVAGTAELAADVAMADAEKPVYAHIEDMGASAAYWIVSQARRITATATSEIGCIGTVAVVEDSSKMYEAAGVTVQVVATGKYKGAFEPGAPVPDAHLDYMRERVEALNDHFLNAVASGRKLDIKAVRESADGRVWVAAEALKRGLIDRIERADVAVAGILEDISPKPERPVLRKLKQAMVQRALDTHEAAVL